MVAVTVVRVSIVVEAVKEAKVVTVLEIVIRDTY